MDHFNTTIYNGALVETKGGLHVSKTKHRGTRFVNTFAAAEAPSVSRRRVRGSDGRPAHPSRPQRLVFVTDPMEEAGHDSDPGSSEEKGAKTSPPETTTLHSRGKGKALGTATEDFSLRKQQKGRSSALRRHNPQGYAALNLVKTPESWKTFKCGHNLSQAHTKLLQLYLQLAPQYLYPCEEVLTHNPVRDPSFFERINSNPATMQSIIMVGSLIDMVVRGKTDFDSLNNDITAVCQYVNRRLASRNMQNDLSILEAIAALAIVAHTTDRFSQWHIHMRGLRLVLVKYGGLRREYGHVLSKVRQADLQGAIQTGSSPYLKFHPLVPPASAKVLTARTRYSIRKTTHSLLRPCGITSSIITPFSELCLFAATVKAVRRAPRGTALLDPDVFMEECNGIKYHLVQAQGPLKDLLTDELAPLIESQSVPADPAVASSEGIWSDFQHRVFNASLRSPRGTQGHHLSSDSDGTDRIMDPLDPIVRVAGILYAERLVTSPLATNAYPLLFHIFNKRLLAILTVLETSPSCRPAGSLPPLETLRPILLWACLAVNSVAHTISRDLPFQTETQDLTLLEECVALLVPGGSEEVAGLPLGEFALCQLLPLADIEHRPARQHGQCNPSDSISSVASEFPSTRRTGRFDDSAAERRILREMLDRHKARRAAQLSCKAHWNHE